MGEAPRTRARLGRCLVASTLLHTLGLAAIAGRGAEPARERPGFFPISLVGRAGGRGGGPDAGSPPAPADVAAGADASAQSLAAADAPVQSSAVADASADTPPTIEPPKISTRPRRPRSQPAATPKPAPRPVVAASSGDGSGQQRAAGDGTLGDGGAGGGGPGDGGGGDGRVGYASNPPPPYPLVARRQGMQGTVLLDVVVATDGRPIEVRVATSSGHALLDDAAATTVRERWRFIAAMHAGVPMMSRVRVPLRFRLTGEDRRAEETAADDSTHPDDRTARSSGARTDEPAPAQPAGGT